MFSKSYFFRDCKMSDQSVVAVFLFVPNIIGYVRIALALLSFYVMDSDPLTGGVCYILSQLLDTLDGHTARLLNQCSKFGAILDQITDRCSFLGLLFILGSLYPNVVFFFQLVAILDISSHWLHLHASILRGKISHKTENESPILSLYYSNKTVLFALCVFNEFFFLALYFVYYASGALRIALFFVFILSVPFAFAKMFVNVVQGICACRTIADIDIEEMLNEDF